MKESPRHYHLKPNLGYGSLKKKMIIKYNGVSPESMCLYFNIFNIFNPILARK